MSSFVIHKCEVPDCIWKVVVPETCDANGSSYEYVHILYFLAGTESA